jgi:acetyl-CoA C-acetyltransferase
MGERTLVLTHRQKRATMHLVGDFAGQPVVVGVAAVTNRPDASDRGSIMNPAQVIARAVRGALDDAGLASDTVDTLMLPVGTDGASDPARAAAVVAGLGPVRTVVAKIGVLQQEVIDEACRRIVRGETQVIVIAGGEAMASGRVAASVGVDVPEQPAGGAEPDELLEPEHEIITRMEVERHLGVPAHQYALIESVLAHRAGRAPGEQERYIAALWASASEVAERSELIDAWERSPWTAADLASGERGNRMLATPYRRRHVSDWNVDQAAAIVITSRAVAERLDVDATNFVSPVVSGATSHMVPLPARGDLAASAWGFIGAAIRDRCGVDVAAVDEVELYSCFPSAVQIAGAELGIELSTVDRVLRPFTVTGGMTFGGGPLNAYVLVSTVAMVRRLRQRPAGATGLVTSVSGLLTKVAAAVWRNGAPAREFVHVDVTADHREVPVHELDAELVGPAHIVAATVVHDRGRPTVGVAVVEADSGIRSVAVTDDPDAISRWCVDDMIGAPVRLIAPGRIG